MQAAVPLRQTLYAGSCAFKTEVIYKYRQLSMYYRHYTHYIWVAVPSKRTLYKGNCVFKDIFICQELCHQDRHYIQAAVPFKKRHSSWVIVPEDRHELLVVEPLRQTTCAGSCAFQTDFTYVKVTMPLRHTSYVYGQLCCSDKLYYRQLCL